MSAPVESLTAGQITCDKCGATATMARDPDLMTATIDAFCDAHHDCGYIHINLRFSESVS